MNYVIYKVTSPSGKSYIGQTNNLSRRMEKHRHSSSTCRAFHNAINKYGWDNMIIEVLYEGITLEEANKVETQTILELNTLYPNGYNLTTGGDNRRLSEYTKQRISTNSARRGKQNLNKGRTDFHSPEIRALISTYSKLRALSPEHKERLRQSRIGSKHSDASKQKISANNARRGKPAYNRGVPHSEERKEKLKIARRARPKKEPAPLVVCPHCGKEGHQGNMMMRWHFDNCKFSTPPVL